MDLKDLSPLESAMKRITGFLPGASLASYASPISYASQANQPAAMKVTPGAAQPVTPAATSTAPAAAPASMAPASMAPVSTPVSAAAPKKPQMISRAALYELQKQKQIENYMNSFNQQVSALRSSGLYKPHQLNFATPDFSVARKPANWGGSTGYMNTSMVENPYAK